MRARSIVALKDTIVAIKRATQSLPGSGIFSDIQKALVQEDTAMVQQLCAAGRQLRDVVICFE